MLTASDIVVLILIVGSGILIWIARNSSSDYRKDASIADTHESLPSAEQIDTHDETNNPIGQGQSEKKYAP